MIPVGPRTVAGLAAACVFLSALVFGLRGVSAWQAAAIGPGVAVTSGFEKESMFALWRAAHGQPVYVDPQRLPYASAYFNWLFYASYAPPVRVALRLSDERAIPRAGRLLTSLGAFVGAGCLFWILQTALPRQRFVAGGLATYVFFGPLVGWWAHTIRPDVWALALETAALAVLLVTYRRRPVAAAFASCLLFYAAWSFKQTYFVGLGTALLFTVVRRQWWPAAILTGGSLTLWAATFVAAGPAYREAFQATAATGAFHLANGLQNLVDVLVKGAPLWLLGLAFLAVRRSPASSANFSPPATDLILVGQLGLLLSLPLGFATSCKLGAYSNYYFTSLLMLALLVSGLIATRESPRLVMLGFVAALGSQLLIALGWAGQISLLPQARELAVTWNAWRQEPEPRFSAVTTLNQPWLNPRSPPLVLAYNYELDRAAGKTFEAGGVGGLIASGYFQSLLLPTPTAGAYDGSDLRHYTRGPTVNGLTVFRRRGTPEK